MTTVKEFVSKNAQFAEVSRCQGNWPEHTLLVSFTQDRISVSSDGRTNLSNSALDEKRTDVRYRGGKMVRVDSNLGDDEERVFLYEGLLGE